MSGSSRAEEARPVRTLLISWRTWSMALAILSLVSSLIRPARSSSISGPAYRSLQRPGDVARHHEVEDPDRQVVVLAEGDGGEVHHPQVLVDDLHERDLLVAGGRRIELGVGAVDAVHARVGPLAEELGPDFGGPERRRRVRGEE